MGRGVNQKTNMSFRVTTEQRARIKSHCQARGIKIIDYIGKLISDDLARVDNCEHDQAENLRRMVAKSNEENQ